MNKHFRLPRCPICGCLKIGVFVVTFGLLSACATDSSNDVTGFDRLTLDPGDTGNCNSRPCRVFLRIPPGSGSYEVTGNETKIGVYLAGQTADLGSFWESQAFQIRGMDVPKAYAYIPSDM